MTATATPAAKKSVYRPLELFDTDRLLDQDDYEGTSEMHLLAIGKALTGQAAFR
ncbi:hypothetical protein [Mycolicibacterium fortuitum]|uniref:hypothetical protein n=1 Tax=Mycolicibacterium fortuitum TaxID=1766 RepID=UPI001CDCAD26|nr:hypothetical protein [Mycolicibacterium fortuitum]UBV18871.1 hypothetical protein H8Z57_11700 [Mycolicibacterium fortuitum]